MSNDYPRGLHPAIHLERLESTVKTDAPQQSLFLAETMRIHADRHMSIIQQSDEIHLKSTTQIEAPQQSRISSEATSLTQISTCRSSSHALQNRRKFDGRD